MDTIVCGSSAFNYYRVPPQLLGLYPPLPSTFDDSNHLKMANSPMGKILEKPIHRLVYNKNQHHVNKLYVTRVVNRPLPFGSIRDTEHNLQVTSPEATLLTMAGNLSRNHLLMALYEMAGSFSVFKPDETLERQLSGAFGYRFSQAYGGWRRVVSTSGKAAALWMRPPLIEPADLKRFCEEAAGLRGVKDLRWAANHLTGICASPLEVQASMLLSLPRSAGGEGLVIQNNWRIPLSPEARTIYPHDCCYADIFIEGDGDCAGVVVECQGKMVHDGETAWSSDSDRATALACMGYEVILLTYAQLKDAKSFEAVMSVIARKAGLKRRPKTRRQLEAQENLREDLFIDWETLGNGLTPQAIFERRRQ